MQIDEQKTASSDVANSAVLRPKSSREKRRRALWTSTFLMSILLTCEIWLLMHDLNFSQTNLIEKKTIGKFIATKNNVRSRSGGTISWSNVPDSASVHEEDSVLTLRDSTAEIQLADNSVINIEPESMVILTQRKISGLLGSEDVLQIRLENGEIRKSGGSKKRILLVTNSGEKPTELKTSNDSAFRLKASNGKVDIKVLRGTIEQVNSNSQNVVITSAAIQAQTPQASAKPTETPTPSPSPTPTPSPAPTPTPTAAPRPKSVHKPKSRLRAPKLKKPTIKITETNRILRNISSDSIFSGAAKDSQNNAAVIELAWDAVEGAKLYRVQVARDQSFKNRILDRIVKTNYLRYQNPRLTVAQKLYYRVAAIDFDGEQGDFSEGIDYEIVAYKNFVESKSAEQKVNRFDERPFHVEVAVGATYQSRTFTQDPENPNEVTGRGIVPTYSELRSTYSFNSDTSLYAQIALALIKAEPDTTNVKVTEISIPQYRGVLGVETEVWEKNFGFGGYFSNTFQFKFSGRELTSQSTLLLGPAFWLGPSKKLSQRFWWKLSIAPLLTNIGVDGSGTLQWALFSDYKRTQASAKLFIEIEAIGRYTKAEKNYGGIAKIGYGF